MVGTGYSFVWAGISGKRTEIHQHRCQKKRNAVVVVVEGKQ